MSKEREPGVAALVVFGVFVTGLAFVLVAVGIEGWWARVPFLLGISLLGSAWLQHRREARIEEHVEALQRHDSRPS